MIGLDLSLLGNPHIVSHPTERRARILYGQPLYHSAHPLNL